MGEPDNTMVMVRRKVSSLAVALHGIKGHAVLLVLCGVLIAAVMPWQVDGEDEDTDCDDVG